MTIEKRGIMFVMANNILRVLFLVNERRSDALMLFAKTIKTLTGACLFNRGDNGKG